MSHGAHTTSRGRGRRGHLATVAALLGTLLVAGSASAQGDDANATAGLGYGPTETAATETVMVRQSYLDGFTADFTNERGLIPLAGMVGTYFVDGTLLPSLSSMAAGVCIALVGVALTLAMRPSAARRFLDDWNRVFTTVTHLLVIATMGTLAVTLGALGGAVAALTVAVAFTLYARGRFLAWVKDLGPSTP